VPITSTSVWTVSVIHSPSHAHDTHDPDGRRACAAGQPPVR
jgi:hypothetical protein